MKKLSMLILLVPHFIMAVSINIKVNVDATIRITPAGEASMELSLMANTVKAVDVTWEGEGYPNSSNNCEFYINPDNKRYADTTFIQAIDAYYNEDFEYTLVEKPLPTDTAFIPVRANVDITLKAIPLEMISGNVPSQNFEFTIPAKTQIMIQLPVENGGTAIIKPNNNVKLKSSIKKVNGALELTLPKNYLNGEVSILSMSGRKIGKMILNSRNRNSLSVSNVANGVYVMNIRGKNGINSSHTFHHNGGTLFIRSKFSSSVNDLTNTELSRNLRDARATLAKYRFELDASDAAYRDTTTELNFTGQLNGSLYFYLINPDDTGSNFEQLLDSITYEEIFPYRYGFGRGDYPDGDFPPDSLIPPHRLLPSDGFFDFYTYGSLKAALVEMEKIEVDLYQLEGHDYMHRITWRNRVSGEVREMVNNVAYEQYKNEGAAENFISQIHYGQFCQEGSLEIQKRELAAFLANISHETTGQGVTDTIKKWGLYWREEAAWQNGSNSLGYVDQYPNELYPPTANQSYHGRGPIQITHNVNYGQLSEFLYGNKQILLDEPGKMVPDSGIAVESFMSAIWFWMTPQAPKPSCHDVMIERWQPTADDISKNRDRSRFGMTINIINGGQECNKGDGLSSPLDRIGFYRRYAKLMGVSVETYCDCGDMVYW